ncbi:MAG: hypothetical protein KGI75_29650 [Rhizobiaceae bacterium]|nr:hypothetical protein [Rhizobiaceae bacterium]
MIGNEYIHKFNRALSFNSSLESRFTMMLLADRNVANVREEWPRVKYRWPGATTWHETLVDRHATYASSLRVAYSVKAIAHLGESQALDIGKLVNEQNTGEHFDLYVVVTEAQITPARSDNAEQIVIACDNRNERHCEIVLEFMRTIERPITFMEVERTLGPDIDVNNSLLCLLYDGLVEHLSPDELFDDAPFLQTVLR